MQGTGPPRIDRKDRVRPLHCCERAVDRVSRLPSRSSLCEPKASQRPSAEEGFDWTNVFTSA